MTRTLQNESGVGTAGVGQRSSSLADRLDAGAQALADFASRLSEAAWTSRVPHDGRTVAVIVHHVASVYPVEIHLAQVLAGGTPVTDVVWDTIHEMNAGHAKEYAQVSKADAIDLLRRNSANASAAIRAFTDQQLDTASLVSLYDGAPLTCQFMLEDHAVRHSYHHLAVIRRSLQAAGLL
jgi:hypothetical protein